MCHDYFAEYRHSTTSFAVIMNNNVIFKIPIFFASVHTIAMPSKRHLYCRCIITAVSMARKKIFKGPMQQRRQRVFAPQQPQPEIPLRQAQPQKPSPSALRTFYEKSGPAQKLKGGVIT